MSAATARESFAALAWFGGVDDARIIVLDRRALPKRSERKALRDLDDVCRAIEVGTVAGVGAVALVAAHAVALHAFRSAEKPPQGRPAADLEPALAHVVDRLRDLTFTNLPASKALGRMRDCYDRHVGALTAIEVAARLLMEAKRIQRELSELTERIAVLGAAELPAQGTIVTIGATGALAKGGNGTALAAVLKACADGKALDLLVVEGSDGGTIAFECALRDVAVSERSLAEIAQQMRHGRIAVVIAGADRITARGDAIGEAGTYALATLAKAHGIPVFVAAPYTVFDFSVEHGDASGAEDVTPAEHIDAVITGRGVIRRPTKPAVEGLMKDRPDPLS